MNKIAPEILGANHSIDIVIDFESDLKDGHLEDILLLSDKRIKKKLLLSSFPPKIVLSFQESFNTYETKILITKIGLDLIIIDRSKLFCINRSIKELNSFPIPIYFTDKIELVKEQVEFFDYLWIEDAETILYNDLSPIQKPSINESLYFGSNILKSKILHELKSKPELLFKIDPFEFEKLVAFLLTNLGYQTFVTPKVKDGGKDILAKFSTPDGHEGLCLVECKRYSQVRKVSIDTVRSLFGVVTNERANLGMIVTTSSFTKEAKVFQKMNQHALSLRDYDDLKIWLKKSNT